MKINCFQDSFVRYSLYLSLWKTSYMRIFLGRSVPLYLQQHVPTRSAVSLPEHSILGACLIAIVAFCDGTEDRSLVSDMASQLSHLWLATFLYCFSPYVRKEKTVLTSSEYWISICSCSWNIHNIVPKVI